MNGNQTRKNAISSKLRDLRAKLWPDLQDEDLWDRKKKSGFTTIPRTMPLIMKAMDSMSNGKPLSAVYLDLWCRAFDEHVVTLNKKEEMAFYSGFTGQRGTQTWSNRIDILAELGFIRLAPGPNGDRSYVVILNPYKVICHHRSLKTPGLTDALYNTLSARAGEIGADDM